MGDRHHHRHHRGGGFSGETHHNYHFYHHSANHFDHQHSNYSDNHFVNNGRYNHSNNHFVNHDNYNNHFAGDGFSPKTGGFSSGNCDFAAVSGQKRGFHHSNRGLSKDYIDGDNPVKLYIIRPLFEEHGNVVEIVLLKDKITGFRHGACFVKYAKVEEAERAIKVLHNLQAFPGAPDSLVVRYADGERERLGIFGKRIYVGGLNKQASKSEINDVCSKTWELIRAPLAVSQIEKMNRNVPLIDQIKYIFSSYGVIEDIHLLHDDMNQTRVCGFVEYANKDMAVAAINALNGTYIMRGCEQPLIVRFEGTKKSKNRDARVLVYGGPNLCPRFREPVPRLGSNIDNPIGGKLPNASCTGIASSTGALLEAVSHQLYQSPSQLPLTSSQLEQNVKELPQPLMQNLDKNQRPQFTSQPCPRNETYSKSISTTSGESAAVLSSSISTAPEVPKTTPTADPIDCDWSEHTCPDGLKYYYHCITCESRWEKPEEYTSFEQLAMKQLNSWSCQQELKPEHIQSSAGLVNICARQVS